MESLNTQSPQKMQLSLDLRIVVVVLLVIIAGMLAMWRPWEAGRGDRTVEVTGQAKVTATPDEFVFYPSYEFKNADKQAALDALTKKSNELVAKIKELGVAENHIKTNSDGYDYPIYKETDSTPIYSLRLEVKVGTKELAQKVQDFLITTAPTGAVSPQANFSDAKRKELEDKARDQATKDARAKAEQSAKNLGFSLGSVKTVSDATGFGGGAYPLLAPERDVANTKSLNLQPGENELNYSVNVTYFVR